MTKKEILERFVQGMSIKALAKKHQQQEGLTQEAALAEVEETILRHLLKTGQITNRL